MSDQLQADEPLVVGDEPLVVSDEIYGVPRLASVLAAIHDLRQIGVLQPWPPFGSIGIDLADGEDHTAFELAWGAMCSRLEQEPYCCYIDPKTGEHCKQTPRFHLQHKDSDTHSCGDHVEVFKCDGDVVSPLEEFL